MIIAEAPTDLEFLRLSIFRSLIVRVIKSTTLVMPGFKRRRLCCIDIVVPDVNVFATILATDSQVPEGKLR